MARVVLVCGVQGSGKSWVCRQLTKDYVYIPHDRCWSHPTAKPSTGLDPKWGPPGSVSTHLTELLKAAGRGGKAVLTEAPFGETRLRDALTAAGVRVEAVFIAESPATLARRLQEREGRELSRDVLARAARIHEKASRWGAFAGTSDEVLRYLRSAAEQFIS